MPRSIFSPARLMEGAMDALELTFATGAAPALVSSAAAGLCVIPDLGFWLAAGALAYALHATFQSLWRGAAMLADLDATSRNRLALTTALPLTAFYALVSGGGLMALVY